MERVTGNGQRPANMTHEIRTPLNAIICMAELLSRERMPRRQMNYVSDILAASRKLMTVVNGTDGGQTCRLGALGGRQAAFKAPGVKALVVDDNYLNLKVAFRLLSLYDITVDMVSSGADAIDAAKKTDYDIVFMDHMMPDMDGIQATVKIRELGEKHKKLPIISLTANVSGGARDIFLASGLNDYLPKPIELDKLEWILWRWLPEEKITAQEGYIPCGDSDADQSVAMDDGGGEDTDIWETLSRTGFINAEIGKARVAGIEEMYREMLDIFYNKMQGDFDRLDAFSGCEDLRGFAIFIHGMKSSLATIGAMPLSELAAGLEKAAKSEDRSYCETNLPPFVSQLRELYQKLGEICDKEPTPEDKPQGDAADLETFVTAALHAAEDYNLDTGVEITRKLLEYDFGEETNRLLKYAQDAFRSFEFAEAAGYLREAAAL